MAPTSMRGIKVLADGKAEVQDVPLPELRDGYVLVKVNCVAINPIDWMNLDYHPVAGTSLGCDFVGIIEDIGPNPGKQFSKGDRVCGWLNGNNKARYDDGAFADYCAPLADLCIRVPEGMSDEDAVTPPAGVATAGMGLFQKLDMKLPGEGEGGKGEPVLIYGGGTATATLGIQLAKLAGYEVITTCSARSFDHVKSLGASAAFDYNDKDCGKKIREYTNDKLTKVFDTASKANSPQICAEAISSKGGKISCTLPYPEDIGRKDVTVEMVFTLGIFGTDFGYGQDIIPGNPEDLKFGKKMYDATEKLLHDGKIKVHPPKVDGTGLDSVLQGIADVRAGKGSGVKIVYKL